MNPQWITKTTIVTFSVICYRNLETISIGTCRLHGSPKLGASTNVSPHHRLHHHHLLHMHHTHHSRVQSLDLMDDIPLPFQTDSHHLGLMNQDSPMLSPNPPPSVIDSNPQNLLHTISTTTASTNLLAAGQTTGPTHLNNSTNINNQINNISSNTSNFNSTTTSTNVIINNIKTNTTTLGTTNPDSGNVHQLPSTAAGTGAGAAGDDEETKNSLEDSCLRNRWHTCPELTKAMDGVTYIADHTKKEEESTRVSANIIIFNYIYSPIVW